MASKLQVIYGFVTSGSSRCWKQTVRFPRPVCQRSRRFVTLQWIFASNTEQPGLLWSGLQLELLCAGNQNHAVKLVRCLLAFIYSCLCKTLITAFQLFIILPCSTSDQIIHRVTWLVHSSLKPFSLVVLCLSLARLRGC